jgi:4-hydroxybenzoate polyprenyltransferase
MTTSLSVFIISIVAFFASAMVVKVEERRGRRLVGDRVRVVFDAVIEQSSSKLGQWWHHFTQYVVRLGWYYSLHSLLRTILQVLVSAYTIIENVFEKNRAKTKALRLELKKQLKQSHFTKIADHKAETSFTPEEQERIRKEKLEYEH